MKINRFEEYKEYADELRLKMRELDSALLYGSEEDVRGLRATVTALRDALRSFAKEIEDYVPADCPPTLRRRRLQEREFIKYYYIMGFTMDRTAEYMSISRDTVYRIRSRLASGKQKKEHG